MRTAATSATRGTGLSMRECFAVWLVALTVVMTVLASSAVALLFEGWV